MPHRTTPSFLPYMEPSSRSLNNDTQQTKERGRKRERESGSRSDNEGERGGEEGQRKRYTCTRDTTTSWAGSEVEGEGRRLEPAINRLNLPLDSPF